MYLVLYKSISLTVALPTTTQDVWIYKSPIYCLIFFFLLFYFLLIHTIDGLYIHVWIDFDAFRRQNLLKPPRHRTSVLCIVVVVLLEDEILPYERTMFFYQISGLGFILLYCSCCIYISIYTFLFLYYY